MGILSLIILTADLCIELKLFDDRLCDREPSYHRPNKSIYCIVVKLVIYTPSNKAYFLHCIYENTTVICPNRDFTTDLALQLARSTWRAAILDWRWGLVRDCRHLQRMSQLICAELGNSNNYELKPQQF